MHDAWPPGQGAIAALIVLEPDAVNEICAIVSEGGQIAVPANLNAPGQIVIAGHAGAVRRAIDIAKERGATMSVELKVSAPFHCPLMKPVQDGMAPILRGLAVSPLKFPVIANVTAAPNSDPAKVADLLIEQITAPVRWTESMEHLGQLGVTDAIEFGCGKVLMGLMRRINKNIRVRPLEDLASMKAVGEAFAQAQS
jgi:[acyl-carrier-protein] S-malonyltransferase